jgi:aspartate/methionine/tyrosine aminotransferase
MPRDKMNLGPFELERYFARTESQARYHLCATGLEPLTVAELCGFEIGALDHLLELSLGYPDVAGTQALRQTLAAELYETLSSQEILIHSGSSEGIFNFMSAVLSPGDHVIVQTPCYPSLYAVAQAHGCRVSRWEMSEGANWTVDLAALPDLICEETRAIVINTPHNPTGSQMQPETLRALIQIVEERGILLFSDEVYRFCEHRAEERLPAACDGSVQAVSLGSMSKAFGAPGLRVGWIATRNQAVLERMAARKDYTTICTSAPSQFLASLVIRHREALTASYQKLLQANLVHLKNFLDTHAEVLAGCLPQAGATAFLRLKGPLSARVFCQAVLEQEGVLLLPSDTYDAPDTHFRIGFGKADFAEGLARLSHFLTLRYPALLAEQAVLR